MNRPSDAGLRPTRVAVILLAMALAVSSTSRAQEVGSRPASQAVVEVTDESGRRVSVPQPVERIVSLAPSVTETLYALGVQDRVVGVTTYCDYPVEAQSKAKVGGAINPNLEQVVALRPDLVVVTRALNRRETVEALERLGIATYATHPRSVEDMLASTARLAEFVGARQQGEFVVAGLRARLQALKQRLAGAQPSRVLFVVWHEPLVSIGRETFLADALRWAGAESVANTTQDWPRLSFEEVLRAQPEYLVFASSHSETAQRNLEALRRRPGWRNLAAVRGRRMIVISDAVNRPAPRLIDAIEQLARALHPDAFGEKRENREEKRENRSDSGSLERGQF